MRSGPALVLSNLTAGIDRNARDASPDALRDALNVIDVNGQVSRRPSYQSFIGGPVWMRPPGSVTFFRDSGGVITEVAARTFDYTQAASGAWFYGLVDSVCDGFALGDLIFAGAAVPTTHKRLIIQYSATGNAWADFSWFLDTTRAYLPTARAAEPFVRKHGRVHWHRPSAWVSRLLSTSAGGLNGLFFRFRFIGENGVGAANPQAQWQVVAPGLMVFDRVPLNGLTHAVVNGKRALVSMADRRTDYGISGGANIGAHIGGADTLEMNFRTRRSSGLWASVSCPNALTPGGIQSASSHGTASEITDQGRDLNRRLPIAADGLYLRKRPYGNTFLEDVTANGGTLSTTLVTSTDARLIALAAGDLEWFMLEVTAQGSSAIPVGQTRLCRRFSVTGGVASLYPAAAFTVAPAADTVFAILRPPAVVYVHEADQEYHLGALSASAARLVPDNVAYRRALGNYAANARINFEVREELRLTLARGRRWSTTIDTVTGRLVMVNGGRPLSFDGLAVEPLASAGEDDPQLQSILGTVAPISGGGFGQQVGDDYRHHFRASPPAGNIVINYGGRLCIADDTTVKWGLPHEYNHIWPLTYEALIRDARGGRITAMAVLYDRLIVATKTGIFEGTLEGMSINFRPTSSGVGFTSHAAVANIAIGQQDAIIGPAPDGLIIYAAGEPVYVIDSWDRVIPGGISEYALEDAVGVAWKQRGWYVMGLNTKTSGQLGNNRLLIYDYVNKSAWLWNAPYGVSALSIVSGTGGKEYLVIGTEDGMIQCLSDGDLDDGAAVAWHVETNDIRPFGARLADFKRIAVTGTSRGLDSTLTVRGYLDDAIRPWSVGTLFCDRGEWSYSSAARPWDLAQWPEGGDKGMPIPIPWGARGRSFRVRIEGTGRMTIKHLELELSALARDKR